MDCEGVTVDPASGDVYYIVERRQEVRRLSAPDYKKSKLLGVISEVGMYTNDGLECITYYKDGSLLVGNQRYPILLMNFRDGRIMARVELTGVSEIADLCYDPVRDVLWILDSEKFTLNLCTVDGEVLTSWNIPFIKNAEGICIDHGHSCIWIGDDTTSKLYRFNFENL